MPTWYQVDQIEWTTMDQWATKCLLAGEVHADTETIVEWWEHRCVVPCAARQASTEGQRSHRLAACASCSDHPNVLFFFFQDMVEDHAGTVAKLADFMGLDVSEEVQAKVVSQSTKSWMSSKQWRHLCV